MISLEHSPRCYSPQQAVFNAAPRYDFSQKLAKGMENFYLHQVMKEQDTHSYYGLAHRKRIMNKLTLS